MNFSSRDSFLEAHEALKNLLEQPDLITQVDRAVATLANCYQNGGKALSCGNGGSMCDAMHFAEELTGRYRKDRRALPALAISDPSHLSCVANDYGYESVFSRMVEAMGQKGDVLLAISTSGNSRNILKAVEAARQKEMIVIGLSGYTGGELALQADIRLCVPGSTTDRIQELHIKIIHVLIEGIERNLFPENYYSNS